MKVETLTPVVAAAPGGRVHCRLRVQNDAPAPTGFRLRVVGFDPAQVVWPPPAPPLEPGSAIELDIELAVPEAFAAGRHAIGFEVTPDRPGLAPVIAAITLTVERIDDIAMAVVPAIMRGSRRARFKLDIDNRSDRPVELELSGEAPDVEVLMEPDRVVLRPGERVRTSGRVRAERLASGDPVQHSVTIAARSRSAPVYASATFHQRPLLPHGFRTAVAMLLILAVGAAAIFAGYRWWDGRQEEARPHLIDTDGDGIPDTPASDLVDTDGDGVDDTPGNVLVDSDGDGIPDTPAAVVAAELAEQREKGPAQAGGSNRPTRTSMSGTVAAADGGQATGVDVTLTPVDLGAPLPERATPLAFRDGRLTAVEGFAGGKLWPARFGRYDPVIRTGIRQTESVPDTTRTDERGVWFFGGLSIGQSYEVSFSRPGYDTQAFIVTPDGSGKPIDLPVELEPATGAVRGSITGPNGPLGNVQLVLSDGQLVFNSASASSGTVGAFEFTGVSTPGTYTLTATAPGLGTEVLQVTLDAGEQRGGVNITMRSGVGSISGRITEAGQPLGGVTLTATNGDTTVSTTSLTEGATGTYLFPRLDVPGRYTITASLDGYITQTRVVNLTANTTGVDFDMVKSTGTIVGLVQSGNGAGLPGVNVRVSRDDLAFDAQTAVAPDAGAFTIRDLPPGTYLVEFSRYDHAPYSQTVTVAAGQVVDLGRITLVEQTRPPIVQDAALQIDIVDSQAEPLGGATVRVFRQADNRLVGEQVGEETTTSFVFEPMDIGTYRIEVTKGLTYRMSTRTVSVGLNDVREVIPLYLMGQVSGRLVDSFTGEELVEYRVQIRRVLPTGELSDQVVSVSVTDETPPTQMPNGTFQRRFETPNPPGLPVGRYRVVIDIPPPGYSIAGDQVLQPGERPMEFVIRPDDDRPIDLGDIEADRYPELRGTVVVPRLGAGGTTTFVPVDSDALTVALTCSGGNGVPDTLTLPTTEALPVEAEEQTGLRDDFGIAGLDSFYFGPATLQQLDLFGACELVVDAGDEYDPSTIQFTISPGDGSAEALVFRNVALFRPQDVGGGLYWLDRGTDNPGTPLDESTRVPADDVLVSVQGTVIVGSEPGQVPYDSTGSDPTVTRGTPSPVVSDAEGHWAFGEPKQVFGEGFYVFSADGRFTRSRIGVTIDETGGPEAFAPADPDAPLAVDDDPIDVQLDAVGGDITGTLQIRTRRATPVDLSGFSADLAGANTISGGTFALVPDNETNLQVATVTFTTPDPGTHRWRINGPAPDPGSDGRPHFVPVDAADEFSGDFFQGPGESISAATRPELVKVYAEMGAMTVRLFDSHDNPIVGASGRLVPQGGGSSIPFTTGADGETTVTGVPVSTALNGTGRYTVQLDDTGRLDLPRAQFVVTGAVSWDTCGINCAIVEVGQGGQPVVTVTVPEYGTISGVVYGNDGTPVPVALVADPLLTVTAVRVADANCTELDPDGPAIVAEKVDTTGDGVPDQFRFAGPEGIYRFEFEHPAYQTSPTQWPPQQGDDICLLSPFPFPIPNPNLTGAFYRVSNDVDRTLSEPFFTLLILPSELTVTVRNDTVLLVDGEVGAPVSEAVVTIERDDSDPSTGPMSLLTGDDGRAVFTGTNRLVPGPYIVEVTKESPDGTPAYFPVRFRVRIDPGGAAVTIDVPLPRVGGSIRGLVAGLNSEGDPVPAPVGVVVRDTYTAESPESSATITSVDGQPQPGVVTAVEYPEADPPGTLTEYVIEGLGSGLHRLSYEYDNPDGAYDAFPEDQDVPVLGPTPHAAETVAYRAADRRVVVSVGSTGDISDAQVALLDPDDDPIPPETVGACPATTPAQPANARCAVFDGVPPELEQYEVRVSKELFGTQTVPFDVPVGNPDTPIVVPVTLSGTIARIVGVVTAQNTPTEDGALSDVEVSLYRVGQADALTTVTSTNGEFQFDITSRGAYEIGATAEGYAPRRITIGIGTSASDVADLGERYEIADGTFKLPRLATFTVTATGGAAASSLYLVSSTVTAGTATVAPSAENTGDALVIAVDPGVGVPAPATQPTYRLRIGSTAGYTPEEITTTAIAPGASRPMSVTLSPRTIAGTVTNATSGTVRLLDSTGSVVDGPATIGASGAFLIDGPVPRGDYTLVAEQLGRGRRTAPVSVSADDSPDVTEQSITLQARDVAVSVASSPAGAAVEITGTGGPWTGTAGTAIDVPETAFPISVTLTLAGRVSQTVTANLTDIEEATAANRWNTEDLTLDLGTVPLPARTISGTVSGGTTSTTVRAIDASGDVVGAVVTPSGTGAYQLTGPFPIGTYTVIAEQLGRGRVTRTVEIATNGQASPVNQNLTLAARNVAVTFSTVPANASISINGGTYTGTGGTAITVPETAFPISYTVSAPGYVSRSATNVALSAGSNTWSMSTLAMGISVELEAEPTPSTPSTPGSTP